MAAKQLGQMDLIGDPGAERRLSSRGALEESNAAFAELDRHLAAARPEHAPALALGLAARLAMIASRLSGRMDSRNSEAERDEALTIDEAARRTTLSKDYLYRHDLPFKIRVGRRVLFSSRGLANWLREQQTRSR